MTSSSRKYMQNTGSFNQSLENDEYAVEKILDMKIIDNQEYYLIKWEGYSEEESTWEPLEHLLNIVNLVEEFKSKKIGKNTQLSIPNSNLLSIPSEKTKSQQHSQRLTKISQSTQQKEAESDLGTIYKKRKVSSSQSVIKASQSQIMEVENSNSQKVSSSEYEWLDAKVTVKGAKSGTGSYENNKTVSPSQKTTQEILENTQREHKLENNRKPVPTKSRLLYRGENYKVHKIYQPNEEGNTITDYSYRSSTDSDLQRSQKFEGPILTSKNISQEVTHSQKNKGSLSLHDKPRNIVTIKQRKKAAGFWFLVEWEERQNGLKPQNSYVSNEELKQTHPDFLLNFYESKIVVFPKNLLATGNDDHHDEDQSQEILVSAKNNEKSAQDNSEEQPSQKKKVVSLKGGRKNRPNS